MDEDVNQAIPRLNRQNSSGEVYVVDDDPDGLPWLDARARHWNLRVERFSSAEEFLEVVNPGDHAVVIAEANLPGMNGLELHQELVRRGWQLPIIIVAKNGDVPGAVQAVKAGARDFLEKPVVPQVLLQRIRAALGGV